MLQPAQQMKALTLALVLLTVACGGFPTTPEDFEFGRADVYARDTDGAAIDGVAVRLERTNGTIEDPGGLTGSVGTPGYYFFLRNPGEFRIRITVPNGYELVSPANPAPVRLENEQTKTVTFLLRRL